MSAAHNKTDGMADRRPLLLLTRPQAASEAFWAALPRETRENAECLINPLMSIHVTGPLPSLDGVTGLIFTSANGLHAYKALGGANLDLPAIAVGEGTAKAVRSFGFDTDVAGGTADQLVQHILDRGYPGGLLHVRGEVAIGDVARRLSENGVPTAEAILYQQKLEPFSERTREALSQDRHILAPVFSPRTAQQLGRESDGATHIRFAAISRAVADALPDAVADRVRIAKMPNRDGMVQLVSEMISDDLTLERRQRDL
ncbi:uroporphyrinogen-III synthase [Marivita geojedonensis]|nr:uroporphyrinogen-III synthase [Marivita geojedonensis]